MLKWTWISLVVVILDQLSKLAASANLQMFRPVEVIPFFNLTLAHNPGAAFSFLADAGGWQRWFFTVLAVAISILLIFWIRSLKSHEGKMAIGLSLVLGGAIGNLIDRLAYGYVVDFLDFYVGDYHWPAFNIADSAITIGAGFLIVMSFISERNRKPSSEL
ncbi:MAG: signal peptidase II [Gammaproteobacteria bacterium]|nr:signal peptidase II [Gammaproteobacteria bacterium]